MEPQADWIWGRRPVEETIRSGRPILRIWISPRLTNPFRRELEDLCRKSGIDCRPAPDAKLASLCGTADHAGIVAQVSPLPLLSMEALLALPEESRQVVFVLDGVENPRNLGLIARTLVASGSPTLVLPAKGGALPGQAFLEASAGYGPRLRMVRVQKLVTALEAFKEAGYWVYGLAADGARSLFGHDLAVKTVFVLGNETDGMRPTVKSACDEILSIPVIQGVDSLNVAVTASLCAFEAVRAGRVPTLSAPAPTGRKNAGSPSPQK